MVQALFVWQESSQLLVQRRYSEMQRSVLASLDQIFNDYYKPRLFKLSKTLVNQISINNNSISNKKLNNWLNLTNGNNIYSRDGAIVSKFVLARSLDTFDRKLKRICSSFNQRNLKGFNSIELTLLRKIPLIKLQNCSAENLSQIIDELELNEGFSRWAKRYHQFKVYAPNEIEPIDKLHRIHPWNIFSQFMMHNSYFLWMGGSKKLGNAIFKPDSRINILGGYKDFNWNPEYSISALDYNLIWSHNQNHSLAEYTDGSIVEPKVFSYILFRKKLLESSFIELVSLILDNKQPPNTIHPDFKSLFDKLQVKINKLFKRQNFRDSLNIKHLITLSREDWRNTHLDKILSSTKIGFDPNFFSPSDYVQSTTLLDHKVTLGVKSSLLFTESNLAQRIIWITILFSLLILAVVIAISFKILPQPIDELITDIKSIRMDSLLHHRLNFPINNSGDEIKTLENSFRLMKSELSLRFRQLDYIRMTNHQLLNKHPVDETLKLLIEYIANCLPIEPKGLALYYFQSARQPFPSNYYEYGESLDISHINISHGNKNGTIDHAENTYLWFIRTLNEVENNNASSYIIITLDRDSLGANPESPIDSFISTLLEQLDALLYQIVLQQIQKDNEIASQLQQGILAPIKISKNHIEIAADMRSAGYLGGDFFNVIERTNDILLSIADVTSKGIAPALVGNCARSLIHYFSEYSSNTILDKVNKNLIAEGFSDQHFVTCFMGTIDAKLTLNYVSAGHQMMIHMKKCGEITYLNGPNIPLGLDAEQIFEIQTIGLQSGDMVFLYTDGIPELQNQANELFSQERLENILKSCRTKTAVEIETIVYHEISQFVGNTGLSDDVTTIIIKV